MRTIALVCGLTAAVFFSTIMAYGNQPEARPLDLLGYALLVAASIGPAWRQTRPEVALAVSAGAAAGLFTLGYALALWPVPALIALFSVIADGRRMSGYAGSAFLVAVPGVAAVMGGELSVTIAVGVWASFVLLVVQPAEVSRARRDYTAEVERRAAEAERTREEEALRRAQEERLRVARELHDVTSHTVSVIALHAAVAAEAVERAGGPAEAAAALQVIRSSSQQAMGEMKAILGVLRPCPAEPLDPARLPGALTAPPAPDPGNPAGGSRDAGDSGERARGSRGSGGDGRPAGGSGEPGAPQAAPGERVRSVSGVAEARSPRQPLPGSAQLPRLVRTAGLPVTLDIEGERRPLPPAADLTVYRVVQEALTNTMRHANATSATVTLTYERGGVTVQVDDDGGGSRAPRGHGLTGMAERVAVVGGRLTTGDGPTGGFRVTARLPA
ncbi:sensor histidine kinase [Nonomuraea diastatica]|uniref:histidine kinase n=1 Tax=Nonomuraea diastatica TaxID=1848329 RepID=A0A4R4WZ14_9ACTN|nr:histidine kinase [Nonomuraea diastatica]TDD22952.1 hypothetical protein E1294_09970 [Nonomuraea diastatica]